MSYRHMNYEPTEFRLTPQTNCTYVISFFSHPRISACPLVALCCLLKAPLLGTPGASSSARRGRVVLVNAHDKKFWK